MAAKYISVWMRMRASERTSVWVIRDMWLLILLHLKCTETTTTSSTRKRARIYIYEPTPPKRCMYRNVTCFSTKVYIYIYAHIYVCVPLGNAVSTSNPVVAAAVVDFLTWFKNNNDNNNNNASNFIGWLKAHLYNNMRFFHGNKNFVFQLFLKPVL